MGVPSEYDHPALAIFDRTLVNWRYIESQQDEAYVFEFTAMVGALLGVLVHPWDRILSESKLVEVALGEPKAIELGFPQCRSSRPYSDDPTHAPDPSADPRNAAQLLRLLRNGIAHGNIELLDVTGLQRTAGQPVFPLPKTNDIVGIEIWNCPDGSENRSWGTALTERDLRDLIRGMEAIINDPKRTYWKRRAINEARKHAMRLA